MAVGHHWAASGKKGKGELEEAAKSFGVILPDDIDDDCLVFPENWDATELFLKCQTQWNVSVGGVTGLNYASVLAMIDMYKYGEPSSVFEDLQVIEIAAMEALNKEAK